MPDKPFDWIREFEGEFQRVLDKDVKLIHEWCETDVLIRLWEHFASMNIYMSTASLSKLKKLYVRKYFTGNNVKELCSKLDVSERFIYEVFEEKGVIHPGQAGLFSETENG